MQTEELVRQLAKQVTLREGQAPDALSAALTYLVAFIQSDGAELEFPLDWASTVANFVESRHR